MNAFPFDKKVAVITGSAVGIGFEIARQLSIRGASVILNDVDDAALKKAQGSIIAEGGNCEIVSGDASELTCIDALVGKAISKHGKLDIAIANAGITTFGEFLEYTQDDFKRLVEVNLQGSFFLAQRSTRHMVKQRSGGRILFMSSTTGHQAHHNLAAYGMTKSALEMLAKSLAVEFGKYGITVNALAPGATLTERTREEGPDYEKSWQQLIPTGKVSTTTDIANAALFLLSDGASQITGQSILVDGGWCGLSPLPDYFKS